MHLGAQVGLLDPSLSLRQLVRHLSASGPTNLSGGRVFPAHPTSPKRNSSTLALGASDKKFTANRRIANSSGRLRPRFSPHLKNIRQDAVHSQSGDPGDSRGRYVIEIGPELLCGALKVTVEGPRGKLSKDLSHLAVNFSHSQKNVIGIEIHHGSRKNVATLRTVRTLINNLIVGVTKGYKYKMRYVYAHFPINVNLDKNGETGLWEVEIRNFVGEKLVRRVVMQPGVDVEVSKAQKDELLILGNSLEAVSQSAADIQQICRVRNKDIRKFLDGIYVSEKSNIVEDV
ncbi:hypothetical protein CHU98_g3987 [Xylaria longipes]|nr:hypothetical protein CHU98_g3987 [Xylaria longipes]